MTEYGWKVTGFLIIILSGFGFMFWSLIILQKQGFESIDLFSPWRKHNLVDVAFLIPDKKTRFKYLIILVACFFCFFGSFIYLSSLRNECSKFEDYLNREVQGIVVKTYYDKDSRNMETIEIKTLNGDIIRETSIPRYYSGISSVMLANDSIVKLKGSDITTVFHPGKPSKSYKAFPPSRCKYR